VADDVLKLLTEHYNISKDNLRVMSSKAHDFIRTLEGKVSIDYETKQKSFYHWDYGMDGVYGCGTTFCLKQKDETFKEIGQLIKIRNSEGLETFEFGFGVETFLSRLQSRSDYSAWAIYHCLPSEYRFKTILDLASCLGATSTINPELITIKHNKEIGRLAKRIALAERVFNIPHLILEDAINKFIKTEFNYDSGDYISEKIKYARELI